MKVLLVGDVVGAPGRRAVTDVLARMRAAEHLDLVVVNAENAAGGRGVTPAIAQALFAAGADVLTMGDHVWDQKDMVAGIDLEPRIVRPANLAPGCPGRGVVTVDTPAGPATVINLLGRVFVGMPSDCPFRAVDRLLAERAGSPGPVLVDFHAEATSEKIAMGWHLDGRVAAVVGSHTHVQTADETVLPGGTAYLTDLGMTGPKQSILGRDVPSVMKRFLTGMPSTFKVAAERVELDGAVVEIDETTARATAIRRVRVPLDH